MKNTGDSMLDSRSESAMRRATRLVRAKGLMETAVELERLAEALRTQLSAWLRSSDP